MPPEPSPSRRAPERELARDPRSFHVPAPDGPPDVPAAPRPPAPRPGPGVPPPAGPRRRRRRWRRVVVLALLAVLALGLAMGGYAWMQFRGIERVAVGDTLSPGSDGFTNYLLVGSDSRAGIDPDNPNAPVIFGEGHSGDVSEPERTDTIVVLRVGGDGTRMMALPRDLYVPIADTGATQRINTAIQGGPARLIRTVQQSLGIPVHHYVEIDFAGFIGLVDAVGGITVDFPYPAKDGGSGLDIREVGPVHLDGDQALAYVRARHYEELIDGSWRMDPTSDLGRVQRQQAFIRSLMGELGDTKNPVTLLRSLSAVSGNLRLDDRMGFFDALSFARRLAGLEPETVVLPTRGERTGGGASVLVLVPESDAALARFR